VKIEALAQFLKVGTVLVPRFVVYSVMVTVLFSYFIVAVSNFTFGPATMWAYIFGSVALVITWLETLRAWRRMP
jgi:hypothetical protein